MVSVAVRPCHKTQEKEPRLRARPCPARLTMGMACALACFHAPCAASSPMPRVPGIHRDAQGLGVEFGGRAQSKRVGGPFGAQAAAVRRLDRQATLQAVPQAVMDALTVSSTRIEAAALVVAIPLVAWSVQQTRNQADLEERIAENRAARLETEAAEKANKAKSKEADLAAKKAKQAEIDARIAKAKDEEARLQEHKDMARKAEQRRLVEEAIRKEREALEEQQQESGTSAPSTTGNDVADKVSAADKQTGSDMSSSAQAEPQDHHSVRAMRKAKRQAKTERMQGSGQAGSKAPAPSATQSSVPLAGKQVGVPATKRAGTPAGKQAGTPPPPSPSATSSSPNSANRKQTDQTTGVQARVKPLEKPASSTGRSSVVAGAGKPVGKSTGSHADKVMMDASVGKEAAGKSSGDTRSISDKLNDMGGDEHRLQDAIPRALESEASAQAQSGGNTPSIEAEAQRHTIPALKAILTTLGGSPPSKTKAKKAEFVKAVVALSAQSSTLAKKVRAELAKSPTAKAPTANKKQAKNKARGFKKAKAKKATTAASSK